MDDRITLTINLTLAVCVRLCKNKEPEKLPLYFSSKPLQKDYPLEETGGKSAGIYLYPLAVLTLLPYPSRQDLYTVYSNHLSFLTLFYYLPSRRPNPVPRGRIYTRHILITSLLNSFLLFTLSPF